MSSNSSQNSNIDVTLQQELKKKWTWTFCPHWFWKNWFKKKNHKCFFTYTKEPKFDSQNSSPVKDGHTASSWDYSTSSLICFGFLCLSYTSVCMCAKHRAPLFVALIYVLTAEQECPHTHRAASNESIPTEKIISPPSRLRRSTTIHNVIPRFIVQCVFYPCCAHPIYI